MIRQIPMSTKLYFIVEYYFDDSDWGCSPRKRCIMVTDDESAARRIFMSNDKYLMYSSDTVSKHIKEIKTEETK